MYSPLFKKYCCGPNIAESLSSIHAYLLPHKKGQIFSSWLVKGDAYVRVCFEHHLKGDPVLFLFYFFQFSGRFKYKVLRYNNKVRISNNSQVKASSSVRNNASVNFSGAPSPPPPPHHPGLLRSICPPCQSRGGAFANFALLGARHLSTPGLAPNFWQARGFLSEYTSTEDFDVKYMK